MVVRKIHSMGKVSLILGTSLFCLMTFPRWGSRLKHSELPPTYSLLPRFWQSGTSCCWASRVCTYTHACMTGIVRDDKDSTQRSQDHVTKTKGFKQCVTTLSTDLNVLLMNRDKNWWNGKCENCWWDIEQLYIDLRIPSMERNRVTLFSQSRERDSLIQTTYYSITLL